ncbi:homoserine O-succinyltransferase MetX [Marinicauda pacifica]|uniref:Homoserine O-succinyltransferase n=1 Tax=Marinicauda pacifica TaxID=1133559 RepID=A0A4S2HAC8_9PROT|nr:homoserine O-succinyltransferase [Marinicauda pacifica]TGY92870.1 homoserine O-succinyltransferase [Marinicauda pacifica]
MASAASRAGSPDEDCGPACSEHVVSLELSGGQFVQATGRLTGPAGAPAIAVLGGVSATRCLVTQNGQAGWWPGVAGEGHALDPRRFQLLSVDFLAENVAPFPTVHDQAEAVLALADAAGLARFAVVGASYGGVVALAMAQRAPERIASLALLAAAGRVHPMAQAWRSIQRDMVSFALARNDGAGGLELARRLAMTTYRTHEEFESRFVEPAPGSRDAAGVAAYLKVRGAQYAASTAPERFLALSKSMDSVEIDFARIDCPCALLGFESDRLVPPGDIIWTAAQIRGARHEIAPSLFGHDGFLKECARVNAFLESVL